MRRALLLTLCWAGAAAATLQLVCASPAAAGCFDYRSWTFGGRAMGSVAADLCGRNVTPADEEGVSYSLGTDVTRRCVVIAKERPVRPGERLPYGVSPSDSPQAAFEKIRARHGDPTYSVNGTDSTPVGVRPSCGRFEVGDYDFEFVFHAGRMTAVRERLGLPYREGDGIVVEPGV